MSHEADRAEDRRIYGNAYRLAWKKRNADRIRQSVADSDRKRNANKAAAAHGAPGRLTLDEVREILADRVCRYCGTTEAIGIDHVVPLSAGGANRPENIVPCCNPCNSSKARSDRPRRWSQHLDACSGCGASDREHAARGLCGRCYQRRRKGSPNG